MKTGIALLACAIVAGSGLAFAQQDPHEMVKGILSATASDDEKLVGVLHSGVLEAGDADFLTVGIDPSKTYLVYATCDFDCSDLDIAVIDEDDFDIDSDYEGDDAPVIEIEPNEAGDELKIRIDMENCDADSCVWALGVYEQL